MAKLSQQQVFDRLQAKGARVVCEVCGQNKWAVPDTEGAAGVVMLGFQPSPSGAFIIGGQRSAQTAATFGSMQLVSSHRRRCGMADQFKAGAPIPTPPPQQERYEPGPSDNLIATMAVQMHAQLREHDRAITTHDGLIKGMQSAVSAVQSSLAAKISIISIVTALLLAGLVFNANRTMAVGDRLADQNTRIGSLEVRAGSIENGLQRINDRLETLPQQIAQELRNEEPQAREKVKH